MTADPLPPGRSLFAIGLRVVALLGAVVLGTWAAHALKEALDLQIMPGNEQKVHSMLMVAIAAYVLLLAMPFVPGAEVGLAMLTAFGAAIVPLVYGATVLAMLLAYAIGSLLPVTVLARILRFFRMRRASDLVTRAAELEREDRLNLLLESAPPRALSLVLRHRYVALALAINVPGNSIVGGGGGIMILAGLSGLFAPLPTFLAIAIGVSPIPLVIFVLGA
ncbi:MAG: hypothetical protein WAO69_14415 [Aestuariivita sp.]|uniref:hypothetical protein n=1 Tax=Aestuariivita sp. TaxID=1872407 RepID=UPI003BAE544A